MPRLAILVVALVAPLVVSYHRKMASNAMDRVDRLDTILTAQLRKNDGDVAAIADYFADSFTFTAFEGQVWNKREFLDVLQRNRIDRIFAPGDSEKVAYFRPSEYWDANDLLVVRFYKGQVNYVLTMLEDNDLPGGYKFLHIKPASS